jgi:hypothetical protein
MHVNISIDVAYRVTRRRATSSSEVVGRGEFGGPMNDSFNSLSF